MLTFSVILIIFLLIFLIMVILVKISFGTLLFFLSISKTTYFRTEKILNMMVII